MATHRTPDGRFSPPSVVARSRYRGNETELEPFALLPLRGDESLLAYTDNASDPEHSTQYVTTLAP